MDLTKLTAKERIDWKKQINKLIKEAITDWDKSEFDKEKAKIKRENTKTIGKAEKSLTDKDNTQNFIDGLVEDYELELNPKSQELYSIITEKHNDVEIDIKSYKKIYPDDAMCYVLFQNKHCLEFMKELEHTLFERNQVVEKCCEKWIDLICKD